MLGQSHHKIEIWIFFPLISLAIQLFFFLKPRLPVLCSTKQHIPGTSEETSPPQVMMMIVINLFFLGGNLKANHLLSKAAGRNKHDPPPAHCVHIYAFSAGCEPILDQWLIPVTPTHAFRGSSFSCLTLFPSKPISLLQTRHPLGLAAAAGLLKSLPVPGRAQDPTEPDSFSLKLARAIISYP